jgi:hypothetical protein
MAEGDTKLTKRGQHFVAAAGAPAAFVGVVGDFFAPKGGWLVVGLIGFIALVIMLYAYLRMLPGKDAFEKTFFHKWLAKDSELNWLWSPEQPLKSHGLHMMLIFGVACLFFAGKSAGAASEGGVLAKHVDAIALAQQQIGISQAMLVEQKKTNQTLSSIDTKADNFKKENSDDPRKELANSGVTWEHFRLTRALTEGDLRTAELFLRGDMPMTAPDAAAAFNSPTPAARVLVVKYKALFPASACKSFMGSMKLESVLEGGSDAATMAKELCGNAEARSYAKQQLDSATDQYQRQMAAYNQELAARRSPQQCVKDELKGGGNALAQEASQFNFLKVGTMSTRQSMLAEINANLMIGKTDIRDMRALVEKYCQQQATEAPNISTDDSQVKKLRKIMDWIA